MTLVSCPTCHKQFDSAETRVMPFCSERCRRIDLNRWLKEEIAIPYQEAAEDDPSRRTGDDEDD
jgi:uncharacterized protein